MTYYDHATVMAFKLDQWSDEPRLSYADQERLACEQTYAATNARRLSFFNRITSIFRPENHLKVTAEQPGPPKPGVKN